MVQQIALETAAGYLAVRILGGHLALALQVVVIPTDSPSSQRTQEAVRMIQFRAQWRLHVKEITNRLFDHFLELQRGLIDLEYLLEDARRLSAVMAPEHVDLALNALTSRLARSVELIGGDLGQLSTADLPQVRQDLIQRNNGILYEDVVRTVLR